MAYVPLARKWRPQTFADVVGQEPVTTTLTNAVTQRRIAHAYLFTGPRGVGKTSTARILAKCLNCEQGPIAQPCQQCAACIAITQGNSLDVLEIDGASNRGIDQIRELRDNVKFLPSYGQFKVYIIDEVHQITADGFNALLKTLEEPPPHVTFIFATTHPEKVLPTILSRCQRFDFRRVPVRRLVELLQQVAGRENITVEEAALFAIARAADGSVRDAESLLDQLRNFTDGAITAAQVIDLLGGVEDDYALRLVQAVLARDARTPLRIVDELLERGKDISQVSTALVETVRHLLMIVALAPDPKAAVPWDELERLIELPRESLTHLVDLGRTTNAQDLLYILQLLARTHEVVKRSPHGRIHLEVLLVKLATRADFTSLRDLLDATPLTSSTAKTATSSAPARSVAPAAPRPVTPTPPPHVAAMPTPAAAAPGALSLERVEQCWSHIIEALGTQRMSLASCLAEGKPLELAGDRLTVGVPEVPLHREMLEAPEARKLIEGLAATALAVPRLVVTYRTVEVAQVPPSSAPHPESHASDLVQSALKMFNAKVVDGKRS